MATFCAFVPAFAAKLAMEAAEQWRMAVERRMYRESARYGMRVAFWMNSYRAPSVKSLGIKSGATREGE